MKPLNLSLFRRVKLQSTNFQSTNIRLASALMILLVGVSGCAVQQPPCEDIVEVNRQIRECQMLKKDMYNKEHPQHALTARKRFDSECVDLRYYREKYDTICKKNQKPITPVE